jgi:polysaccharide biosynthesis protein PslH
MNLLFITPSLPYPARRGFELIPYHRIRMLSRQHDITLAYIDDGSSQPEHIKHMQSLCKKLIPVQLPKLSKLFGLASATFSGIPFQVGLFSSYASARSIQKLSTSEKFDLIHVYMLRLGELIPDVKCPVVLDLIDSMSVNFERRIPFASWPIRILLHEEVRRLKRYEPTRAAQFPHIFVSKIDRNAVGKNGWVIPLGVDTSVFNPCDGSQKTTPAIIFTGNMFYEPNQQAVAWFLEHCWPRIHTQFPSLQFRVAGNSPPDWLLSQHGTNGISVLGSVPSIANEVRQATIAIAPMQSGSGMQFKILESMACAVPVIASTLGLGAIKATDNESILLADTPEATNHAIGRLLNDASLHQRIGRGGLEVIRNSYTWESHCSELSNIYDHVLKQTAIQ